MTRFLIFFKFLQRRVFTCDSTSISYRFFFLTCFVNKLSNSFFIIVFCFSRDNFFVLVQLFDKHFKLYCFLWSLLISAFSINVLRVIKDRGQTRLLKQSIGFTELLLNPSSILILFKKWDNYFPGSFNIHFPNSSSVISFKNSVQLFNIFCHTLSWKKS